MIPKSELQDKITESSSSRRTWIEMYTLHRQKALTASSSSSRRTWIEISAGRSNSLNSLVVLLAEDVDRNDILNVACRKREVVLLAEDVDRNLTCASSAPTDSVVLLAEDVDRNVNMGFSNAREPGRPPRGGRG